MKPFDMVNCNLRPFQMKRSTSHPLFWVGKFVSVSRYRFYSDGIFWCFHRRFDEITRDSCNWRIFLHTEFVLSFKIHLTYIILHWNRALIITIILPSFKHFWRISHTHKREEKKIIIIIQIILIVWWVRKCFLLIK